MLRYHLFRSTVSFFKGHVKRHHSKANNLQEGKKKTQTKIQTPSLPTQKHLLKVLRCSYFRNMKIISTLLLITLWHFDNSLSPESSRPPWSGCQKSNFRAKSSCVAYALGRNQPWRTWQIFSIRNRVITLDYIEPHLSQIPENDTAYNGVLLRQICNLAAHISFLLLLFIIRV